MRLNFVRSALAASAFPGTQAPPMLKIVVGATQVPHAEILEVVKPQLAKEGVELDIKVFSDYVQPNLQLNDKQLDANFFQHKPYLESFNRTARPRWCRWPWCTSSPSAVTPRRSRTSPNSRTAPRSPSRTIRPTAAAPGAAAEAGPGQAEGSVQHPGDRRRRDREPQEAEVPRAGSRDAAAFAGRRGPGADQHQLRAGSRPGPDQGRAVHRRLRLALRQRAGDPRRQQGRAGHQEAGQRPARPR